MMGPVERFVQGMAASREIGSLSRRELLGVLAGTGLASGCTSREDRRKEEAALLVDEADTFRLWYRTEGQEVVERGDILEILRRMPVFRTPAYLWGTHRNVSKFKGGTHDPLTHFDERTFAKLRGGVIFAAEDYISCNPDDRGGNVVFIDPYTMVSARHVLDSGHMDASHIRLDVAISRRVVPVANGREISDLPWRGSDVRDVDLEGKIIANIGLDSDRGDNLIRGLSDEWNNPIKTLYGVPIKLDEVLSRSLVDAMVDESREDAKDKGYDDTFLFRIPSNSWHYIGGMSGSPIIENGKLQEM